MFQRRSDTRMTRMRHPPGSSVPAGQSSVWYGIARCIGSSRIRHCQRRDNLFTKADILLGEKMRSKEKLSHNSHELKNAFR